MALLARTNALESAMVLSEMQVLSRSWDVCHVEPFGVLTSPPYMHYIGQRQAWCACDLYAAQQCDRSRALPYCGCMSAVFS